MLCLVQDRQTGGQLPLHPLLKVLRTLLGNFNKLQVLRVEKLVKTNKKILLWLKQLPSASVCCKKHIQLKEKYRPDKGTPSCI